MGSDCRPSAALCLSVGAVPQVLKERGVGCGIVVAAGAKATAASFSLRDPNEVLESAIQHRPVLYIPVQHSLVTGWK